MLTFDQERHEYRWNGVLVPNVTRIIAPLVRYSRIPHDALDRLRQEGLAIHRMVELDCNGDLDVEALPKWLSGYYQAWGRFRDDTGFEPWAVEQHMYHMTLGYAGTPDLIGLMPRLKCVKGPANIDVKRSFYGGPAIGLQTAGYTRLWNDNGAGGREHRIPDCNRFALQLRADGSYRLEPYADDEDFIAFLACLQQFRWASKHYPKENRNGNG